MKVSQTKNFGRQKKNFSVKQIKALDEAVMELIKNPLQGEPKKGDLQGVRVLKYKINRQQYLLAYVFNANEITLHAVATHENFYRDLKKIINK